MMNFNNDILNYISTMSDGDISHLSNENYVKRGYQYFNKGAVELFKWHSEKMLEVQVMGTELYKVSVILQYAKPNYVCSCYVNTICKHIICVILTIKNLLTNNILSQNVFKNKKNSDLKRQLLKGNASNVSISSHNSNADFVIYFQIMNNAHQNIVFKSKGNQIQLFDKEFPKDLLNFLAAYAYDPYTRKSQVVQFLHNNKFKYSLYIKTEEEIFEPTINLYASCEIKIELNILGSKLHVKCIALVDNIQLSDYLIIDKDLLLSNKIIYKIKNTYAIDYFKDLENYSEISYNYAHFELQYSEFENLSLQLKDTSYLKNYFILKVNNEIVAYETSYTRYRIFIEKDKGTQELMLIFNSNFGTFSDKPYTFWKNIDRITTKIKNKSLLTVPQTKKIIANSVAKITLLSSKKEVKNIAEKAATEINLTTSRSLIRLFNNVYDELEECYNKPNIFFCSSNRKYKIIKYNSFDEIKIIATIHNVLQGKYKNNLLESELLIKPKDLYKHLATLQRMLALQNVDLFYNKKQLKVTKLDIKIEAKSNSIDWMELHPEIKRDGTNLNNKELEYLLAAETGLVEQNDVVQIIDENSQMLLDALSKLMKKNSRKKHAQNFDIVIMPRLNIFDLIELKQSGIKIKLSKEDETILTSLENFKKIKKIKLPEKLQAELKDYQQDGYNWLSFLYNHRFGACLADDMGLGKTIQTIAFLAGIKESIIKTHNKNTNLIVMPPSLIFNWIAEIQKFYPDLKVNDYTGTNRELNTNMDVILTTYNVVKLDLEKLNKIKFNIIVFDEAQAIKNIFSKRTSSVRQLQSSFKLCLTGTPLENHIGEYYSIMDLALPGLLPEYKEFKSQVSDKIEDDEIIKSTKPFILRRTKEKILTELPTKLESDVYLNMNEFQKALYTKTIQEVKNEINDAYKTKTANKANIIALTSILRLRQICTSPELVTKIKIDNASPKIEYLINKLSELNSKKLASLVFSQFIIGLDIIEQRLKTLNIKYLRIDGSVPVTKRKAIVKQFQNDTSFNVLLLSLKTGGVGLNLTRANNVFHVDPWWNPSVENQASDRSYRLGQNKDVFVSRLLMKSSIEEKIMQLKKNKQDLFNAVMEGTKRKTKTLSKADFDFILS